MSDNFYFNLLIFNGGWALTLYLHPQKTIFPSLKPSMVVWHYHHHCGLCVDFVQYIKSYVMRTPVSQSSWNTRHKGCEEQHLAIMTNHCLFHSINMAQYGKEKYRLGALMKMIYMTCAPMHLLHGKGPMGFLIMCSSGFPSLK